ncbi:MAG TPA: alpha/beta hydrolase [Paracoccaceae bacterium]|nr:alpha/beta hydrolase [Paracoccaceae bacterium]
MNEVLTLVPDDTTPSVAEWAASGAHFSWRGHRVFYRDEGEGEALLMIHGVPMASWAWARVWPLLRRRYRLIAVDLLGFGLSDKPPELVADVAAQAAMCRALLTRIGVARYRVLAGDYGATVAQELLARRGYPALAGLCLLNGGIFPEAHRPSPGQRLVGTRLGRPLARLIWRGAFAHSLRRMSGPETRPDRRTVDALWSLLMRDDGRAVLPAMMGYTQARRQNRDRWVGALTRATVPCRFVCGIADPVAGRRMADAWRAHLPGRDVIELPGIGHWPELEAPRTLADAVLDLYGPEAESDRIAVDDSRP